MPTAFTDVPVVIPLSGDLSGLPVEYLTVLSDRGDVRAEAELARRARLEITA